MDIIIQFENEAIWQAADDNGITFNQCVQKLRTFANHPSVKKMILEGTILNPFPEVH
tara:strand:+ start:12250 stop:12420 length:171 start_codon:yes stop_codon:yes gene_type:complete